MERYRNSYPKKLTILAHVIGECEDLMICDLAETYHILDYKELSPELVATLVLGLKDEARVKRKYGKMQISLDQMLLATIADLLRFIAWTKTKAASKGRPYRETSLLDTLNNPNRNQQRDNLASFKTVEEYEAYMKKFEV